MSLHPWFGRVEVRGNDECWPFVGRQRAKAGAVRGYRLTVYDGELRYAHRVAFYLTHGYWPNVTRHTCDNPPCCNPAHLLDGTKADNHRDAVERGRNAKGAAHGNATLDEAAVRAMVAECMAGECAARLADKYGTTPRNARSICSGERWRHLWSADELETMATVAASKRGRCGKKKGR